MDSSPSPLRFSFLAHEPAVVGRGRGAASAAGGAGHAVAEQAQAIDRWLSDVGLRPGGATVAVICPRPSGGTPVRRGPRILPFDGASGSLDELAARYAKDPERLGRFRELLGDAPVLAHHLPAALVTSALGLPTLVALHSLWPCVRASLTNEDPGPRAATCAALLETASAVLVATEAERAALLRTAPAAALERDLDRRVVVVGQGASPHLVRAMEHRTAGRRRRAWRARLVPHATDSDVVFTVVGRLVPYKRVLEVIESFTRVAIDHRGARLLVVGPPTDPRYAAQCRAAAQGASASVAGRITFTGPLPLDAAPSAGDVLVHASRFETWGRAIDEAFVGGCPAVLAASPFVAARLGRRAGAAPPDEVIWLDSEDPAELDAALARALSDAEWRAFCGARARREARGLGWERPVRALLGAWNDVEHAERGTRPFPVSLAGAEPSPCAST